jgi:hypothetical protein
VWVQQGPKFQNHECGSIHIFIYMCVRVPPHVMIPVSGTCAHMFRIMWLNIQVCFHSVPQGNASIPSEEPAKLLLMKMKRLVLNIVCTL